MLRLKKGRGWEISTNIDHLPFGFYYRYSKNDNCSFWWVAPDDVEFVKHGEICINNPRKLPTSKDLSEALDTISYYCCFTSCDSCKMSEVCNACKNKNLPFAQIGESLKELEESEGQR